VPAWDADAVLFDFGGTLDTDGVHWCEEFRDVYARAGLRPARSDFDAAFLDAERELGRVAPLEGVGFAELLDRQLGLQLASLSRRVPALSVTDDLRRDLAAYAAADVETGAARARAVLAALAPRRRIGVVSNFYGNLAEVLRDLRLSPWIAASVDSARAGVSKPDPAIFRLALQRLGVAAERCVVVGDAYDRDIEPAKAIGCRTVWLKGRSWKEWTDVPAADAVIASVAELPALLA
jgi:HAD superfamily hydrolase (TIGR01549 family)